MGDAFTNPPAFILATQVSQVHRVADLSHHVTSFGALRDTDARRVIFLYFFRH